jgi:quinol monooxygenase YgiN
MIVLYATIPLEAQHREAAIEMVEDLVEQSRAEDGVIDYRATTDVEDPNTLRFVEQYEDEAALQAHLETDHYERFERALPEWLAGRPDVVQFEVSEVSEPDL